MEEKLKTGIEGLDELLSGGLPRGGTYLVMGHPGTGKTILSVGFLLNGSIKYGDPGVYVLVAEDKSRLLSNMQNFGWNLESEENIKGVPRIETVHGVGYKLTPPAHSPKGTSSEQPKLKDL